MKSGYLNTPNAAIALNFKVGSSTLSRAVIAAHQPELNAQLVDGVGFHYPAGMSADDLPLQGLCDKVNPSERPVILLLVRNPVDKFRSACAESSIDDVDAKLTELVSDWGGDVHFWPQSRLLFGTTKLYVFPDHLEDLATEADLALPLPNINVKDDTATKPTLTAEQQTRVEAIYADDIELFASITKAGQVRVTPMPPAAPEPTAEPLPVPESLANWRVKAVLDMQGLTATVDEAIANLPDNEEKIIISRAWHGNGDVSRTSPTVTSFTAILNLTDAQVDDMFRLAATFNP
jgi:hypothetical protein